MKTGLRLFRRYRAFIAYINLVRFWLKKRLIGFDVANLFLRSVDKISLQMILRKNGAVIGENCNIETGLVFHNCKDYSNLTIGDNCHIGKDCFFDLRDKISIGNRVVISMRTTLITHTDSGKSFLNNIYPPASGSISIGDDCYIGASCTIIMNVRIGEKSVVAAGSVVTMEVEPQTLVCGVPAVAKKRIS